MRQDCRSDLWQLSRGQGKRQRTAEAGEGEVPDRKGRVRWHFIAGRDRRAVRHEATAVPLCLCHLPPTSLTHSLFHHLSCHLFSLVISAPHWEKCRRLLESYRSGRISNISATELSVPDWAQAHTLNNSIKQPLVTGQMDRHREGEQYKSEIILKI